MLGFRRGLQWLAGKIVAGAQRLLIRILSAGPVPKHVAFIMDGNRRYARRRNQKVQYGHRLGFVALRRVYIVFCMYLCAEFCLDTRNLLEPWSSMRVGLCVRSGQL
jgi:hypothetical protein